MILRYLRPRVGERSLSEILFQQLWEAMKNHALSRESVVAMLHSQRSSISRKRPTIAEEHLAFAELYPGFEHEFVANPPGGTANRATVELNLPFLPVGSASQCGTVHASVRLRHEEFLAQFGIAMFDGDQQVIRRRSHERTFGEVSLPDTCEINHVGMLQAGWVRGT